MATTAEIIDSIKPYIFDPNLIQIKSTKLLTDGLNGKLDIPDPNNPFMFLLENSALLTSAMAQSAENSIRNMYPILASNKEELYHHLNSSEINDVFATPSKAMFNIFINKKDMVRYGYNTDNFTEILLPKYSYITVNNVNFTLLNDISIRLYKNNKVFAKAVFNDLDISLLNNVILDSYIVTDNNNLEWILLNIELKQVKYYNFKDSLIYNQPYKKDIIIDDYFTYIRSKSLSNTTNTEIYLDTTFSNFVYNQNKPTLLVKPQDNKVSIEIPITYIINELITSYLDVELFTTQGDIILPLSKISKDDFTFSVYMPNTNDERIIGINNININISSSTFTYGGKKEMEFEDLKQLIINYSTGDNSLPITIHEIKEEVEKSGFIYRFVSDSLLCREFIITKNISGLNYNLYSNIDLFYDTIEFNLSTINSSKIKIKGNDSFILEPYQLFELIDGSLKILSDTEINTIRNLAESNLPEYNKHKVFFNIYKYIIDYNDVLHVRAYDVNQPSIENPISLYNNNVLVAPVTLKDRSIYNYGSYYTIDFNFGNDSNILSMDISKLYGQIKINLENGNYIYFKGNFNIVNDEVHMIGNITNSSYITQNDKLLVNTDVGILREAYIDLNTSMELTIYSIDQTLATYNSVDTSSVIIDNATVILYKESNDISLGIRLDNLFTNYTFNYTERKFLTYEEDIYLTYTENVYELDENGLIDIETIDSDGDGSDDDVVLTLLHAKGDYVLDDEGNKIIKHHKGDVIINEDGEPTVDYSNGVLRYLNILLIEDKFIRSTDPIYKNYRIDYFITLTNTIKDEIDSLNKRLLENTKFKFLPLSNVDNVTLIVNNKEYSYNNYITPTVTIYKSDVSNFYLTDDIEQMIYLRLQELLQDSITISSIERELEELLGPDVLSVRLGDIVPDNNINALIYTDKSSRFTINKVLIKNDDGYTIVKPNINIKIAII